jgi:hypothetical protein
LEHNDASGASSIVFRSKNNAGSDYAYIQYHENVGETGPLPEKGLLTIGIENDSGSVNGDRISLFSANGSGFVGVNTKNPNIHFDVSGSANISGNLSVGDVSMNAGLRVASDSSFNSNLFVNGSIVNTGLTSALNLKAPLASPSFTGDVSMNAGLRVASDSSFNANLFVNGSIVNTGLSSALGLKAPLASPAFTGIPTSITPALGTNTTQIATTQYVRSEISALIASAPGTLDTLNELAAALGNDAAFSTTVTNSIALKAPSASPSFTGSFLVSSADASFNGNVYVAGSIVNTGLTSALALKAPLAAPSFTGLIVSAGDVSLNAGLRVARDSSFNGNLFVNGTIVNAGLTSSVGLKANIAAPSFTGTMISAGDVSLNAGLRVASDSSFNANLFVNGSIVNTGLSSALGLKAPLASPAFTGIPTSITPALGTNTTQIATTQYVRSEISALIASAPATLDTLNELAAALGNDAAFSTTVTNSIGLKAPSASPSFTGAFLVSSADASFNGNVYVAGSIVNTGLTSALNLKAPLASPAFTGTMVSAGDVSLNAGLRVASDSTFNSNLYVGSASSSTSVGTGALVVAGGVSVGANLFVNGPITMISGNDTLQNFRWIDNDFYIKPITSNLYLGGGNGNILKLTNNNIIINSNLASTNSVTGALIVSGGAGIAGNMYACGIINTTLTRESTSKTTGALQVAGGAGIGGNVYVGGNLNVTGSVVSPSLTGTPTAPTAIGGGAGSTQIATTAYVRSEINTLIGGALPAFDTLNELAIALGNNSSFSTTVTNSIALKAPIDNPTFTGTVGGITKSMVGLGNVENTSDADKPVSSATTTQLNLKANIASPSFTGTMVSAGDVSLNAGLRVASDSSFNNGLYVGTRIGVGKTANALYAVDVNGNVNLTGNLFTNGVLFSSFDSSKDISLNANLTVARDSSFNGNLFVGGSIVNTGLTTALGLKANIASPVFTGDVSMNAGLRVARDSSFNANLFVGGSIVNTGLTSDLALKAPLAAPTFTGTVSLSSSTESTGKTTGALTVAGGAGIGGNVQVGGNVRIASTVVSTSSSTGALIVGGGVGIDGAVNTNNNITTSGIINTTNSGATVSGITGAIVVNGGIGVGGNVWTSGRLTVNLDSSMNGNVNVGGNVRINSLLASTSSGTGALTVGGGVGVGGNLYVGGSIVSPSLTGTPVAPTPSLGTNTTQIATTAYVRSEISALISSAPSTLDTLNELAAALGNDAAFSTTVTNSIASKAPSASPAFTGTFLVSSSDASFNGNLFVNGLIVNTGLTTALGLKANVAAPSFTGLIVSAGDVSLNAGLRVQRDSSFNSNLFVSGTIVNTGLTTALGLKANIASPVFTGDVSMNSGLRVALDSSFNNGLYVGTRIGVGKTANALYAVDVNGNINLTGNLFTNGVLFTSGGGAFDNSKDISLNANLTVARDSSFNANLFVGGSLNVVGSVNADAYIEKFVNVAASTGTYVADFNNGLIIYVNAFSGTSTPTLSIINLPTVLNQSYVLSVIYRGDATSTYFSSLNINGVSVPVNGTVSLTAATSYYVHQFCIFFTDATTVSNNFVVQSFNSSAPVGLVSPTIYNDSQFNGNINLTGNIYSNGVLFGSFDNSKDISLNANLTVARDSSFNRGLYVGTRIGVGKTASTAYSIDVSGNVNFTGNLFTNGTLFTAFDNFKDISLNANLTVARDSSFNANLYVGRNLNVGDSLNVVGSVNADTYIEKFLNVASSTGTYVADFNNGLLIYINAFSGSTTPALSIVNLPTTLNQSYVFSVIYRGVETSTYFSSLNINGVSVPINGTVSLTAATSYYVHQFCIFFTDATTVSNNFVVQSFNSSAPVGLVSPTIYGNLSVGGNIDLTGQIYINGSLLGVFNNSQDLSLNAGLRVARDVSFNSNVFVGGTIVNTGLSSALGLKANIDNPTFTGTVGGITKTMVGLANVDNTSDANKPVSTATTTALALKANIVAPSFTGLIVSAGDVSLNSGLRVAFDSSFNSNLFVGGTIVNTGLTSALNLKANIASPVFTGTPTSTTAGVGTNTTQIATTAYVRGEINALVNSAPGALDTLNELAAALGNDAAFSTTVTNSIALKAPSASPSFTGTFLVSSSDASFNANVYVGSRIGIGMDASSSYAVSVRGAINAVRGVLINGNPIEVPLASLSTVVYDNYCSNFSLLNASTGYEVAAISTTGRFISLSGWNAGHVLVSTDYGATWTVRNSGIAQVQQVTMSADGKYQYIAGLVNYRSADYGTTWAGTGTATWTFAVSSTGQYVLAGASNALRLSTDYGASWSGINGTSILPGSGSFSFVAISSSGQIQAMNVSGTTSLYVSRDFGLSWKFTTLLNVGGHMTMSGTGQYIIAVAPTAVCLSSDYGATFASIPVSGSSFDKASLSANGQYQLVSNSSGISYSIDYGLTWTTKALTGGSGPPTMTSDGRIVISVSNTNGTRINRNYSNQFADRFNLDVSLNAGLRVASDSSFNGNLFVGGTIVNTALTNALALKISSVSPSFTGTVVSVGDVSLNAGLRVALDSFFNGNVRIASTVASTNSSSGALIVGGGVGIDGVLNTNNNIATSGVITTTNSGATVSGITGAIIVNGGIGVGGNLWTSGRLTVNLDSSMNNNVNVGGNVCINSLLASTSSATGALIVAGGVGVGGNLYVGGSVVSPSLTGTPNAPTAALGTNTTQIATTAYVRGEINALVNSAPGALDTLNELAASLGNDAAFSTTVTNSIALKAPLASPSFTGTIVSAGDVSLNANLSVASNSGIKTNLVQSTTSAALLIKSDGTQTISVNNNNKMVTENTTTTITNTNVTIDTGATFNMMPTATIIQNVSSIVPSGFLLCNGQAISRTGIYAKLFAAVGTTFGVGDNSSTFNVPNFQGAFLRGAGAQTVSGTPHTAAAVGTPQVDDVQKHIHTYSDLYWYDDTVGPAGTTRQLNGGNYEVPGGDATGCNVDAGQTKVMTSSKVFAEGATQPNAATDPTPEIGAETRPFNYAVYYYIRF